MLEPDKHKIYTAIANSEMSTAAKEATQRLFEFSLQNADELKIGTGDSPSFLYQIWTPEGSKTLFLCNPSSGYGSIQLSNFGRRFPAPLPSARDFRQFKDALLKQQGFGSLKRSHSYPGFEVSKTLVLPKVEEAFQKAVLRFQRSFMG
ncbi:MAG: hypothetical protein WD848_01715 [Dehalococcoidia bacterium]